MWDKFFPKLQEFKEKHGHLVVRSSDSYELSTFVTQLRFDKKNGMLSQDKVELLQNMGFVWDTKAMVLYAKPWEEYFQRLEKFKAENGHLEVPK